jgi:hypothetical protein
MIFTGDIALAYKNAIRLNIPQTLKEKKLVCQS